MDKWSNYIVDNQGLVNDKWSQYEVNQNRNVGEIMTPSTFKSEEQKKSFESGKMLGGIGQFVGGLGGALALPIHPYIGAATGGTLGKLAGQLVTEQIKQGIDAIKNKDLAGLALAISPLFPLKIPKEKGESIVKETAKAGIIETITAPLGIALNFAGKGILKGLLGARVAERGFEVGFKRLLDPEFYKNRVPKMIAEKTSKFFNRLSKTTGEAIENLLQSPKYRVTKVLTSEIKDNVQRIIPEGSKYTSIYQYIDDIIPVTRPNIEKMVLKQETKNILAMGGKERKLHTLWLQRKKLDKLINSRSWGEEASDYLRRLRTTLNNPIKSAGDDIAKSFHRYQFVKEGEYDLGKKFMAVKSPEGEIYASPAESFAAEIMQTKKDDLVRRLKSLDNLANADDKIIDKFLDYAASEALDKKVGFGIFQEILVGILGGRKSIAKIGRFGQLPIVKVGEKMLGRAIPTITTDILSSKE